MRSERVASNMRWWETGAGLVIAILFWFLICIIAIVATAQSVKRWDTLIATLAMGSQAFFAAAVWRLSKNQFAYTKQVSERQHKIDYYLLPWLDFGAAANLKLAPENGILLDAYRFDTLEALFDLTRRAPLKVAA